MTGRELPGVAPFTLVIRQSDKRCRGERFDKAITGWCRDALTVLDMVRRKERAKP